MEPALSALLQAAGGGRYDVLGELGKDDDGAAYLARERATNSLVALQLTGGTGAPVVDVHRVLGADVSGRGLLCPFCGREVGSWSRYCQACGGDLGVPPANPDDAAALERVLKASAAAYELLGEIPRADGGAAVRFARERTTGSVVALSLTPRTSPRSAGESFDLTATRLAATPPLEPPAPPPASSPTPTPGAPADAAPVEQAAAGDGGMVCPTCSTEYPPGARFCLRDGLALQPRVQRSDLIGQIIAGRYQLLRNLGEGGMGRVFLAEQIKMGRKCAVKILHKELAGNPESLARFSREAREVGRLDHPNIVQIHDFGEDDSGITYLAMEYVDGVTLTRILHETGGPLPVARALAIGSQVAEALVAAHAAGLVHRDIKPDNVLVTRRRDGSDLVKVVDFGIAKAMYNDGFDTLTRTGYAVGTSRYMSPEQLIADPVDGRSDVYSCGCVLWEMLVGHPLWQGGAQEYARRLQQPAPRVREEVPQLAPELDDLVAHALEPRPEDRLQAALELRDGLEQLLDGLSEVSRGAYRHASPATGEPRVVSRLDATPVPGRRTGREAVPGPAAPAPAATGGSSGRVPLASTTPPAHPAAVVASSGEQETLGQVPPSAPAMSPETAGAAAGSIAPGATRISGRRVLAGALGVAGLALVIAFIVPWRRPSEAASTPSSAAPGGAPAPRIGPAAPPAVAQVQETTPAAPPPASAPPAAATPAAAMGRVQLRGTLPPGAVVLVDGRRERRREFPHSFSRMAITVRAPGYAELQTEATVAEGLTVIALPPLQPLALATPAAPRPGAAATPARQAPPAAREPAAHFSEAATAFVHRFADAIASGDPAAVRASLGIASNASVEAAALESATYLKAAVTVPPGSIHADPGSAGSPPTVRFQVDIPGYGVLQYQAEFFMSPNGSSWTLIKIRRTGP